MKARGVYVRRGFPGLVELRAVDDSGHTIRQLTVLAGQYSDRDVRDMWSVLDNLDSVPANEAPARRARKGPK